MEEIMFYLLFVLAFYCLGSFIYKFIVKNEKTYDETDFVIVEYDNGEEIRLFKNLKTNIYEELR